MHNHQLSARFSENHGVFTPYPGGKAQISAINDDGTFSINGRDGYKVWPLPDGRLINQRLTPYPRYRQVLDYFIHHVSGNVIIQGHYPFFWTSTGVAVWLDADGIMKPFDPGPIDQRVQLKMRVAKRNRLHRSSIAGNPKRTCQLDTCGQVFKGQRSTARFCSRKCQNRFNYMRRPKDDES